MKNAERPHHSLHEAAPGRRSGSDFDAVPGEAEADALRDAFLKSARPDPASQALALFGVDSATRARAINRLQQERGNVYVQRMLAELPQASGVRVQREDTPPRDPEQAEREQREQQAQQARQPSEERLADTAKDLLRHYASEYLRPLGDRALRDLARAWREAPAGVIAAGTILGTAGIAYLIGTGSNLPRIPPIPLDFLAGRLPVFRGAELNVQVTGPITGPDSIRCSITFREQMPAGEQPTRRSSRGRVFTPRLTLRQEGVSVASPESGSELNIRGRVPIPSDATGEDVTATSGAIYDGRVEVDVGGSPAGLVTVVSVADNYRPDRFGLTAPPVIRYLAVHLRTTVPPMFHQGRDEIAPRPVWVRINGISSEGEADVRVHLRPLPSQPTAGSASGQAE